MLATACKAVLFLAVAPWMVAFSVLRYRSGEATLTAAVGMSLFGLLFFLAGLWFCRILLAMHRQERAWRQAQAD